jgi:hypothetical protein
MLAARPSSTLESMAHDDVDAYEAALRRLPEAHSLALRLRSAGVADEVVCGYLHIEPEGMDTLLRVAEGKLDAELHKR